VTEHDAPAGVRYEAGAHASWIACPAPSDAAQCDALYDAFIRARFDDTHSVVVLRLGGADLDAPSVPANGGDPSAARYRQAARRLTLLEAIETCPHTTLAVFDGHDRRRRQSPGRAAPLRRRLRLRGLAELRCHGQRHLVRASQQAAARGAAKARVPTLSPHRPRPIAAP
jgi:hypothetical protein